MSSNPYDPPKTAGQGASKVRTVPRTDMPSPAPGGTITASQDRAKDGLTWEIAFGRDELWLVPPGDGDAIVLTHLEVAEYADLVLFGSLAAIVVRELPKRITLWLPTEAAVETLRQWLGQKRMLHVAKALKKRLRFSLPLGLFVGLSSTPLLLDRWDPFAFVFGVGLVGLAIVSPYRPHHALFAIDGALWLSLATSNVIDTVRTGVRYSLFFTLVQVMLAFGAFKAFRFYRGLIHFSWRSFSFARSLFAFSALSVSFASPASTLMRSRRAMRSA